MLIFILFFSYFLLLYLCLCFIFFFKQKTAYEMRFRDGSADVCSSDLFLAVLDRAYPAVRHTYEPRPRAARDVRLNLSEDGTYRRPPDQPRRSVLMSDKSLPIAIVVAAGFAETTFTDTQKALLADGRTMAVISPDRGLVQGGHEGSWGQHFMAEAELRSEEHTSELQSPMRIS